MSRRRKNENGAGTKPIQRPDGRWAAAVTLPDGSRKWFYGRTSTEVRKKLSVALDRVSEGRPVVDSSATVSRYFEDWSTSSLEASNRRPRTRALYRQLLRTHVLPVVGDKPLRDLRPSHLERVLLVMEEAGKSVSTRRSTFNALSALLADAKRDDLIARNPIEVLSRPTGRTTESRHLERDEVLRLLAAARGDDLEPLWLVMLSTGIRRGEAVGLNWSDVDLDEGCIRIRRTISRVDGVGLVEGEPKTARGRRTIPLPPTAIEALRRHRTRQAEQRLRSKVWYEPEVVFSTGHGTRLEPRNVSRSLSALAKEAGISGSISPHTLRHTYASTLLGDGEDLAVVSELLGHGSSVVTLTVYQHVLRRNRDRATSRVEAFLSAPSDNNSDNNEAETGS